MTHNPADDDHYSTHTTNYANPANRFLGQPIITDQINREGMQVVWRQLEQVLRQKIPGDIVEFGCYAGTTSLFIRRQLDRYNQSAQRAFHVYDSFAGLPEKTRQDESAAGVDFTAGKLGVSKQQFVKNFQSASLQLPVIHKGWFSDITDNAVPQQLAFAFLDGDFYSSILTSLKLVWPRMAASGAVLIDDYGRIDLPGVERAVRDYTQGKQLPKVRVEHNIAILIKP
jgi:O-methyltransferase